MNVKQTSAVADGPARRGLSRPPCCTHGQAPASSGVGQAPTLGAGRDGSCHEDDRRQYSATMWIRFSFHTDKAYIRITQNVI